MQGWARLDTAERDRFLEAFLRAALRLDKLKLRAWLRRRLKNRPLAPPFDPACLTLAMPTLPAPWRAMPPQGPDADGAEGGPDTAMAINKAVSSLPLSAA